MSVCYHQLKTAGGVVISVNAEECPICLNEKVVNLRESAEILKKMLADAHAENAAATDEYRQLLGVMRYALNWLNKEKSPVAYGAIEHALKDASRKNHDM